MFKVRLRSIASAVMMPNVIFTHGCALNSPDKDAGILVMGASGAGKTTLVSNVMRSPRVPFQVVNDDWGAVDLETKRACFTGEERLHMKIDSVRAFAPELLERLSSDVYTCRDDRLLISPAEVFGAEKIVSQTVVRQILLLTRDESTPAGILDGRPTIETVERGGYSAFYGGYERFFNGSLILDSEATVSAYKNLYDSLLRNVGFVQINNTGSIAQLIDSFYEAIG